MRVSTLLIAFTVGAGLTHATLGVAQTFDRSRGSTTRNETFWTRLSLQVLMRMVGGPIGALYPGVSSTAIG